MKKNQPIIPKELKEKYLPKVGTSTRERILEGGGLTRVYRNTFPNLAFKYCLLGADRVRLAEFFGVTVDTVCNWIREHPKFAEAIEAGGTTADSLVAESLYNRAIGYDAKEERLSVVDGEVIVTEIRKHYPADITAAKFWLSNRQRDKWRATPEIEINATLDVYEPNIKRFDGSLDDDEDDDVTIIEGEVG